MDVHQNLKSKLQASHKKVVVNVEQLGQQDVNDFLNTHTSCVGATIV
jgi:hypothetical protein